MKKSIITIFTILLLITSGVNFVSAENSTEKVVTNVNNKEENKIPAQRNAEEEKKQNR